MAGNIREAPARDLEIRPTETGIDATQNAARRIGAFYHQASQDLNAAGELTAATGQRYAGAIKSAGDVAVKQIEHHEISTGSKNLAAMQADITEQWNNLPKDPNDPTIADKFREQVVEPRLQQFAEQGFLTEGGQKFAQGHVAALRQHMFEKTAADMSTLAGQAAVVNHRQTENLLSNGAYNDPSSLKFSLDTLKSSTEATIDSSPNLTADARGKLKAELMEAGAEKIVKSAAIGYIEKTGKVPPWASDPAYSKYVNGVELRQFQKAADAQTKANDYHDRQTEVLKKQQADLAVHKDAGALMSNGVTTDPNNPSRVLIAPNFMQKALDIARKNPDAPSAAATARTMIDWAEMQHRQRAEPVVSDPATKSALLSGLTNPNDPTNEMKILRAEADDKLSTRDGGIFRAMVKEMGPDLNKDPLVKAAIDGARERSGVGLIADGHERYSSFMQAFYPQYMAMKRAGTLPPNALDLKDPKSLISQSLKSYEPSMDERMMAHALKNLGMSRLPDANPSGQGEKVISTTVTNAKPPDVGTVKDGFRFKGGNPALPANWEKVK